MKRIAVLGSTGSIGTSCLEVAAAQPDRFRVVGLSAHTRRNELAQQTHRFLPRWAVFSADEPDESAPGISPQTELLQGSEKLEWLASHPEVDLVVAGIVGSAGLRSTWAALEAGKSVAFANKETLVVAGPLMMDLARQTGAKLLPVDSEHSAVFQAMQAGSPREVRRIVLTASGGPFKDCPADKLAQVTPTQALEHPTWSMGPKITVDSATMMNKALEVIEARWLFDLDADQIEVIVHPQSIVHAMVEFVDGSVIAQLSPPDMKLPIQYALNYPDRIEGVSPRLDLTESLSLSFEPPDLERFPALGLGFEVARRGGTCGAVLNAANEVAVERFLAGELAFPDIPQAARAVLDAHDYDESPTLDGLLRIDRWARKETVRWTSSRSPLLSTR